MLVFLSLKINLDKQILNSLNNKFIIKLIKISIKISTKTLEIKHLY